MSIRGQLRSMLDEYDRTNEAVSDLWTWLPSEAQSKKRRGNAHYNRNVDAEAVIREAAKVLSFLAGYRDSSDLTEDEREWIKKRFGPARLDPVKAFSDWEFDLPPEEEEE